MSFLKFFKRAEAMDWIVVFLGNPGLKFNGTRHNVGFMTGDVMADDAGVKINRLKFKAMTVQCQISGESVFLMKPQTYMNLSGDAVREAMGFYKTPLERVIVVSDDVSLELGRMRIRRSGSAGGHNGLKDIIAKCGGEGFPRVKVGVGSPPSPEYDMADWVLSVFRGKDAEIMVETVKKAADAVKTIITAGVDKAMNTYNSK